MGCGTLNKGRRSQEGLLFNLSNLYSGSQVEKIDWFKITVIRLS